MKFIDEVTISVKAGNGGNGCISFFKKKFFSKKHPNGGNGGKGGNILVSADRNINTLIDYQFKKNFLAENGKNGRKKNCTGRSGKDLLIKVPIGTRITDLSNNIFLGDMLTHGQTLILARGGFCGIGNHYLDFSKDIFLKKKMYGKKGENKKIHFELSLLADVGMLGLPNSGKSTFVRAISSAKTKISNYPFTTLFPILGKVYLKNKDSFIIADIPGIIKGASKGTGLGISFLKHIKRCKMLLHLIDLFPEDNSDPIKNISILSKEIKNYEKCLSKKTCWLVFNKIDLCNNSELSKQVNFIKNNLGRKKRFYIISALKKIGINELCKDIMLFLKNQ